MVTSMAQMSWCGLDAVPLSEPEARTARHPTLDGLEPVLRSAVMRLRPESIASQTDDLIQESRIRLARALGRGQHITGAYVKRVAWSVIVDALRRSKRTADQPTAEGGEELEQVSKGRTPEELVALAQLREGLQRGLESLSNERRDVLTLYLVGHTIQETADRLGITYKQADNRIYRGLAALRESLRRRGICSSGR